MPEAAPLMAHRAPRGTDGYRHLNLPGRSAGGRRTQPVHGRWQSGVGLGRSKQGVQKWRRAQRVYTRHYRCTRNWQHMQLGVLPQANRTGAGVRMLVHQAGVVVVHMQGQVIMVVVTVALGMHRHVFELAHPVGRHPRRQQRCRLPDQCQHQQDCASRTRHTARHTAGHCVSLATPPLVIRQATPQSCSERPAFPLGDDCLGNQTVARPRVSHQPPCAKLRPSVPEVQRQPHIVLRQRAGCGL
jgi:hypothetical protein